MKTAADRSGVVRTGLLIMAAVVFGMTGSLGWFDGQAIAQGQRLVGTIEGRVFTGAVLDVPGTGQVFYRLNETLPDGSRVVGVFDDHILLRSPDGTQSELYATAGSGGRTQVSQSAAGVSRTSFTESPRDETQGRRPHPFHPGQAPADLPFAPGAAFNKARRPPRDGRRDVQDNMSPGGQDGQSRRRDFMDRRGRGGAPRGAGK